MMPKFIHRQWLLRLFVLVCVGCGSSGGQQKNASSAATASAKIADYMQSRSADQLWASPLTVPAFVSLDPNALKHNFLPTDKLCIRIRQEAIWEAGDKQLDDFTRNVITNSKFKVDNSEIALGKITISQTLSEVSITDQTGKVVALVGDPLEYCVPLSTLSLGLHKASLQVTSTSGTVYAYAWAFRVSKTSSAIPGI